MERSLCREKYFFHGWRNKLFLGDNRYQEYIQLVACGERLKYVDRSFAYGCVSGHTIEMETKKCEGESATMNIEQPAAHVIKYEVGAAVTMDDMQKLAAALEQRLTNRETFGLIMARNGEHKKNPEVTKWWNGWLKQNKPLLKTYCAGVALVTNSEGLLALYKPLVKMMIAKMFGCAGDMFAADSEAIAWLHDRLGR